MGDIADMMIESALSMMDDYYPEEFQPFRDDWHPSDSIYSGYTQTNSTRAHTRVQAEFLRETKKAVCYKMFVCEQYVDVWFPKKLCREIEKSSVYVWTPFFEDKMLEVTEEIEEE